MGDHYRKDLRFVHCGSGSTWTGAHIRNIYGGINYKGCYLEVFTVLHSVGFRAGGVLELVQVKRLWISDHNCPFVSKKERTEVIWVIEKLSCMDKLYFVM